MIVMGSRTIRGRGATVPPLPPPVGADDLPDGDADLLPDGDADLLPDGDADMADNEMDAALMEGFANAVVTTGR